MKEEAFTVEQFRYEVERAARGLPAKGFLRSIGHDSCTATTATVAYVGRHVAFEFLWDVRDQAVKLMVTRCQDGRLIPTGQGGYRSSVFSYLLDHCGFRGRAVLPAPATPESSVLQIRILAVLNLLDQPGAIALMEDRPDSLP